MLRKIYIENLAKITQSLVPFVYGEENRMLIKWHDSTQLFWLEVEPWNVQSHNLLWMFDYENTLAAQRAWHFQSCLGFVNIEMMFLTWGDCRSEAEPITQVLFWVWRWHANQG